MAQPARSIRRRAALAVACAAALPVATLTVLSATAADGADGAASFERIDIDDSIQGASFTSVGEVFAGEQNIVTSGYGALDGGGLPLGGGTLQVYRPGATLEDWTKVTVFDATADIVFPNQPTIVDVDGDGDQDIVVPGGNFFEMAPPASRSRGSLTWWENEGAGNPFVRHDVVTGTPWSYHGVQYVDLDGDGIRDLLSTGEQGMVPGDPTDDLVEMHFFKGTGDGVFLAAETISNDGGSLPIVADVDGDGDLDIASSQYFHLVGRGNDAPSFLWLERTSTDPDLSASDFTTRPIATVLDTDSTTGVGMGFQLRPVPDYRGPGTLSWVGTNHNNRCTNVHVPGEAVFEFTPTSDKTRAWTQTRLSDPAVAAPPCPTSYRDYPEPTFSDQITSRYGYGQGAPGVFGYGDIDGDTDVDLLVSGDGDRRLWWIESLADGGSVLHRLTEEGEHFGQAGGAVVADLDGDGRNELVFSSFDQNTLAIWKRTSPNPPPSTRTPSPTSTPTPTPTPDPTANPSATPTTPTPPTIRTVRSTLRLTPARRTVRAGAKSIWKVRLQAAAGGGRRTATVVYDPVRGKNEKLRKVVLRGGNHVLTGRITYRPKVAGVLKVRYAGRTVSATLRDTAASDTARVTIIRGRR